MADLLILTIKSENGPPFVCAASQKRDVTGVLARFSAGRINPHAEVAHWTTWSGQFEPLARVEEWALIDRYEL